MAALCTGAGRAVLQALAQAGASEEAVRFLTALSPWEQCRGAVSAALRTSQSKAVVAALEAVSRAKDASLVEEVAAVAARATNEVAEMVAATLGALGGPRAEQELIALLARRGNVAHAAAEALGRVGTAAAVEPLLETSKQMLQKQPLLDAVALIQSRLRAEPGRLSVASDSPAEGGLSEASDASGALSLTRPR